jgi:hypothetical protein
MPTVPEHCLQNAESLVDYRNRRALSYRTAGLGRVEALIDGLYKFYIRLNVRIRS